MGGHGIESEQGNQGEYFRIRRSKDTLHGIKKRIHTQAHGIHTPFIPYSYTTRTVITQYEETKARQDINQSHYEKP